MICPIKTDPNWIALEKAQPDLAYYLWNEYEGEVPAEFYIASSQVKEGVPELFESNPELATIGTPEQYSQYLDSIFPDSKLKDIVYHGSIYQNKQKFEKSTRVSGHYFATTPQNALQHAQRQLTKPEDASLYRILLNIKNPRIISKVIDYEDLDTEVSFTIGDELFYDGADGIIAEKVEEYNTTYKTPESTWIEKQIIAFEPEQIHILGNKEDLEGFKKFVQSEESSLDIDIENCNLPS